MSKNDKDAKVSSGYNNSHNNDTEAEDALKALALVDDRPRLKPPRTLETTLFDRLEKLYGTGIKRVLQVQYRSVALSGFKPGLTLHSMNEHIAKFPSETLYDTLLISAPSVAKRSLLSLPTIVDPTNDDAKDALESTVVFFDTAGCEFFERSENDADGDMKTIKGALGEGSKSNENEAGVVAKWTRKLVSETITHCGCRVDTSRCSGGLGRARSGGCGGNPVSGAGIADILDAPRGVSGDDDRYRRWPAGTRARGKTDTKGAGVGPTDDGVG